MGRRVENEEGPMRRTMLVLAVMVLIFGLAGCGLPGSSLSAQVVQSEKARILNP